MKTFSLKNINLVKADALTEQDLKEIKGGATEGHDVIASTGVYGGGTEPPPDN